MADENKKEQGGKAGYNDQEAGNTPNPTGTQDGLNATTASSTPTDNSGEAGFNTPGSETGDTNPETGNAEQKAGTKKGNPGTKRTKNVTVPGSADSTQADTPAQNEPETATDEERQEFQRLKTKEHNMPLSPEDVDRLETLKVKIEGK